MRIIENQVFLKELSVSDYSNNYLKWMNDKKIHEFTEQKYFKHTKKKILKFIEDKNQSKNEFLYGIFLKTKMDSKFLIHVGNIKLGPIDFYNKYSFISYFIGEKKYTGMNIMTVAIKKTLKIAKKRFKIKKIFASFIKNNVGSKKVLRNNGFLKEGELKNYAIYKNKRVNNVYYGKEL